MDVKLSTRQWSAVKSAIHGLTRAGQLLELLNEMGEDTDERVVKREHLLRSLSTLRQHAPAGWTE